MPTENEQLPVADTKERGGTKAPPPGIRAITGPLFGARQGRKSAFREAADKIRNRGERIATITAGHTRQFTSREAADKVGYRRERIAAIAAGKTGQLALIHI